MVSGSLRVPESCGWPLKNGSYKIKWFDGDVAPKSINVIFADSAPTSFRKKRVCKFLDHFSRDSNIEFELFLSEALTADEQ